MKFKSAIRDKVVHELAKALQAKIAEGGSSPAFNRKFLFVKKVLAGKESTAGSPLRVFSRSCSQDAEWVYPPGVGQGPLSQPRSGFFISIADIKQNQKAEVTNTEPRPDITITSKRTQIIGNTGFCASYRRKNRDNRIIVKG